MGGLILLVFAFKWSILDANNIPSGSMIPTLKIGDYLFVNKMRFSLRIPYTEIELVHYDHPSRGDIITFIPPPPGDADKHYVKRVMGMPGDLIRIRNVPACRLEEYLETGVLDTSRPLQKPDGEREKARDFSCDRTVAARSGYSEPVVAVVEYREDETSPWKNYHLTEMDGQTGRKTLTDSDSLRVLHPDYFPPEERRGYLPVLFKETINGKEHYLVETTDASTAEQRYRLCPTIDSEGCRIPEGNYMVLGDNRDDSKDSRYLGWIPEERILGKAYLIYFSINWRDYICMDYSAFFQDAPTPDRGFLLPDFPPEDQHRYCSDLDAMAGYESVTAYIKRTLLYRIPRLAVRWDRIGTFLK